MGRRAEIKKSPGASRPGSLEKTAVNKTKTASDKEFVFDLHVCKMAHTCPHVCTFTYKQKHKYLKHTHRYREDVSLGD